MIGTEVTTTEGNVHATVNDMTMDSSGRLNLLILSRVPGRGAHKVAVPFEGLEKTATEGALVLNVQGDRLAMAPVFDKSDLYRSGHDEGVYRFFLNPPWTGSQQPEHDPYRWGGEAQGF